MMRYGVKNSCARNSNQPTGDPKASALPTTPHRLMLRMPAEHPPLVDTLQPSPGEFPANAGVVSAASGGWFSV